MKPGLQKEFPSNFSLTWKSDPADTHTLWKSPDCSEGSWTEVDNNIPGDAGATTTYPISGISTGQTEQFYQLERNP